MSCIRDMSPVFSGIIRHTFRELYLKSEWNLLFLYEKNTGLSKVMLIDVWWMPNSSCMYICFSIVSVVNLTCLPLLLRCENQCNQNRLLLPTPTLSMLLLPTPTLYIKPLKNHASRRLANTRFTVSIDLYENKLFYKSDTPHLHI